MFFESIDGIRYPSRLIVKIGPAREVAINFGKTVEDRTLHSVELSNGDAVEVHAYQIANLVRQPTAAFTAATGTYIVTWSDNEISKTPVIGWSISEDGGVYPVTMNGVNSDLDQLFHVLLPSGDVATFDEEWASFDDWRNHQFSKAFPTPSKR